MSGPIDPNRQQLLATAANCRAALASLQTRTQNEIDAAQLAGNTQLRDALQDFISDIVEAIQSLNRQQIAALDDQIQSLNAQLANLTQSLQNIMSNNQKIAAQLQTAAGIISGISGLGGQIFG